MTDKLFRYFGLLIFGLVCLFGLFAVILSFQQTKLWSQEAAGWTQAFGSVAAIWAGFSILSAQQSERDKQTEKEMRQIIHSLADEVRTLTAITRNGMGQKLLATNSSEYFPYTVPINENPFPIYSCCALFVPKIENEHVRRKIIETYTTMLSVVGSFKMNNLLIAEYVKAHEVAERTQSVLDVQKRDNCLAVVTDYLPKLQSLYMQAIQNADELDQIVKNMEF